MNIADTIAPKSDQMDYEDLLGGPKTLTITGVRKGPSGEQPVEIAFQEFDRPWRPAKTARRVLVACWGPDAATYTGRRVTLFGDPTVKWAGAEVGGIRMSHASHIDAPVTVSLTVTRGKRSPITIQPLPDAPKPATGERVTNAVNAIHKATTADELAIVRRRIPADLANEPAIVQALKEQVEKTAQNQVIRSTDA